MLTANAALQVRTLAATSLDAIFDELADTLGIDCLERIRIEDLVAQIVTHEGAHVVAAEAERHLGQVVGTEAEELGGTGHAVGGQGCARDLDHRTEMVSDVHGVGSFHLGLDPVANRLLETQLAGGNRNGDHNLRQWREAFQHQFRSRGENGAVLRLGDQRIGDVQTDAAVTHHRVGLMQFLTPLLDFLDADTQLPGQLLLLIETLRDELMERRIEQTEDDRLAVHNLKGALDSGLDVRLQLGESILALLFGIAKDHLAKLGERRLGIAAVEHMLDTEEADAFGTEGKGALRILRRVRIGTDAQAAVFVHDGHELDEERVLGSVLGVDLLTIDITLGTVEAEPVPFLQGLFTEADGLGGKVDLHRLAADDAALAPATGDEGRVRGHAAAGGKDTGAGAHTLDVFRRGLLTDQDDMLATGVGVHRSLGGEDDRADGAARRGRQTLGDNLGLLLSGSVQDRVQDFIQLGGRDAHHGGLLIDHALIEHIHRHLEGGKAGALADTALQHVELAVLDGELDVLHVVEVVLQQGADPVKLLINLGHRGLKGLEVLVMLRLGGLVERVRGADARDHVLTLGVDQPLTIELIVTGSRVARESDTRSGGLAHVAEYHRLDIDGGAPIIGDLLDAAVRDGTLAVPRLEHATDRAPKLSLSRIRELHTQHFLDLGFELLTEGLELLSRNLGIRLVSLGFLELTHHAVKLLTDTLAVLRLDTLGLLHHDVGIHHDQTAISVIDKARVAGLLDHTGQRRRAKADVEDGIHHTGHRTAGTGAAAHQEGILGITEFLAHQGLGGFQRGSDFLLQAGGITATKGIILCTALGRDGESSRDRESQFAHFCQVGTLATEQFAHRAVTFSGLSAKTVHSLLVVFHLFVD